MPTYNCLDCSGDFKNQATRGPRPLRCEPCIKKRHRIQDRGYKRANLLNRKEREKKFNDFAVKIDHVEHVEQVLGEPSWDVDSIPDYSDIFSHHSHDSGSGIDSGSISD